MHWLLGAFLAWSHAWSAMIHAYLHAVNLEAPLRLFMGEIGPHHRRVPFQYGRVVWHHLHERGGVHRRRRYSPGQRTLRLTAVAPFADAAASHGSARGSCEHASLTHPVLKNQLLNRSVNSQSISTHPLPSGSSRRLRGGDTVFNSHSMKILLLHSCTLIVYGWNIMMIPSRILNLDTVW